MAEESVALGASTRFHHVANGRSVTETLEAAGIPGTSSIWADPLYDGPVPGRVGDDELLVIRERYLSAPTDDAGYNPWGGGEPARDGWNSLREWRAAIERHDEYDELVLWFEHDLFDQLNLIQLLTWIRGRIPAGKVVSLVCIGSFPGHPRFKGLGELAPQELASLLNTREPVGPRQYDLAERAWAAFREPTPEPLDGIHRGETSALPYLAAALKRFLQEYPWTLDGLSRTERRLLQLAEGGIRLSSAFPRMHEGEDVYYVTDTALAALAGSLSGALPPLLTLAPTVTSEQHLFGSVSLTDTGRQVLAAQRDRVAVCGLDRWLGGVHLQPGGRMWRWDDRHERVVAA